MTRLGASTRPCGLLSLNLYSSPGPSVFSNSGSVSYRFWCRLRANNAQRSLLTVPRTTGRSDDDRVAGGAVSDADRRQDAGVLRDKRGRLGLVWGKAVPEGWGRGPDRTRRHTQGPQALRLAVLARCGDLHARLRTLLGERGARRPGRAGRDLLPRPRAALAVARRHRRDRAGNDRRALALRE